MRMWIETPSLAELTDEWHSLAVLIDANLEDLFFAVIAHWCLNHVL